MLDLSIKVGAGRRKKKYICKYSNHHSCTRLHLIDFVRNSNTFRSLSVLKMGSIKTPSLPQRGPPVGISALVVGAGVAGLLCALELWRQGIDVQIIDRSPSRNTSGMSTQNRRHPSQPRLTSLQAMDLAYHTTLSARSAIGLIWPRKTKRSPSIHTSHGTTIKGNESRSRSSWRSVKVMI